MGMKWHNTIDVKHYDCDGRCGIPPKKIPCIYMIIQISTGAKYIGQTRDFHQRYQSYEKKYGESNRRIKRAIVKYGWDDFIMFPIEVFDEYDDELLYMRERYWIDYYDTALDDYHFNHSYNWGMDCKEDCYYYILGLCMKGVRELGDGRRYCHGCYVSKSHRINENFIKDFIEERERRWTLCR